MKHLRVTPEQAKAIAQILNPAEEGYKILDVNRWNGLDLIVEGKKIKDNNIVQIDFREDVPLKASFRFYDENLFESHANEGQLQEIYTLLSDNPFVLAARIEMFIEKYAAISPNYKGEFDEKYTGPDPYQLVAAAELLKQGTKPTHCFSEWGSGCYKPYTSAEGREEHKNIVTRVYQIINT